ncbi:hypothetical protein ACFQX6_67100 [Streptosporangium lutulentum]
MHRYIYVTEGTRDAASWDLLTFKAEFIDQLQRGAAVDDIDDVDEDVLSMAKIRAMATGNPLLIEKTEISAELKKLQQQHRDHGRRQGRLRKAVQNQSAMAAQYTAMADLCEQMIARRVDTRAEAFAMELGEHRFTKRADAWAHLKPILQRALVLTARSKPDINTDTQIGHLGGFPVWMQVGYERDIGARVHLHFGKDTPWLA